VCDFQDGRLEISDGTPLSVFLGSRLNRDPAKLAEKLTIIDVDGSKIKAQQLVFRRRPSADIAARGELAELAKLERRFYESTHPELRWPSEHGGRGGGRGGASDTSATAAARATQAESPPAAAPSPPRCPGGAAPDPAARGDRGGGGEDDDSMTHVSGNTAPVPRDAEDGMENGGGGADGDGEEAKPSSSKTTSCAETCGADDAGFASVPAFSKGAASHGDVWGSGVIRPVQNVPPSSVIVVAKPRSGAGVIRRVPRRATDPR